MGTTARWRTSRKSLSQHLQSRGYLVHCNLVICSDQDECHHPTSGSQSSSRFTPRHHFTHKDLCSQHQPTTNRTQITSGSSTARCATRSSASIPEQHQSHTMTCPCATVTSTTSLGLIDHPRCYLDSYQAL